MYYGHFEVASSYFLLKDSCKNFPCQFRHCGSQFVIMKLNLTLALRHIKSLYIDTSLLKKQSLSDLLIWHSRTKCFSSSISLQMGHFLSATGVLGMVCLPLSISSICELQRNFAIAWRYFASLTRYRYGSIDIGIDMVPYGSMLLCDRSVVYTYAQLLSRWNISHVIVGIQRKDISRNNKSFQFKC